MQSAGLFRHDRFKRAFAQAQTTLATDLLVNPVRLSGNAVNRLYRTDPGAKTATFAQVGDDFIPLQSGANTGRAFLLFDMGLIFVAEIPQRA